ncbi:MAG: primosomal protein N' [Bacteroidales bacterium]|nr:primosomal protein N' [Bacteroidales bacterium]
MSHYADIILPVPLQQLFTYGIPDEMMDSIRIGSRVVVPFGRSKSYSGIVRHIHQDKPDYELKEIQQVVDYEPIVTEDQLKVWDWMSQYYVCSLGEIYRAALPSGLKLESESKLIYNAQFEAESPLSDKQEQILNFVETKKICTIGELQQFCKEFNVLPQLKKLLAVDALFISEQLRDSYKPKTESFFGLSDEVIADEKLFVEHMDKLEKRAPKQLEALMMFLQLVGGLGKARKGAKVCRTELAAGNVNAQHISELCKKGILALTKEVVSRIDNDDAELCPPHDLSETQQNAHNEIVDAFGEKEVCLLHGVTSSGKTEIYIHLIAEQIAKGKQVLYLLPEIALTTQITQRLRRHFGSKMCIYHSKFSDAERVEVWNKLLQSTDCQLILGVRSSVMLPMRNLGLIIVDEEHETSYKQFDPAPRYNARDMALVLGRMMGAKVLLGSATPSYESYVNAKSGKYAYVAMTQRYAGIEMPEIIPVDMLEARKKKQTAGIFSHRLRDAIGTAINAGEQVILFQNRRGFSPYVECNQCAWVPKCQNCDVSLTYHKTTRQLVCHYCSYTIDIPKQCPCCGSPYIEPQGFGTEKIEEEVQTAFPDARIVRMDLDTARTRTAYEKIIGEFEEHKYDILVGTQMISKGLDFERVSVVGVMNADNMLNMPDFRAHERCYQMIAQVSGRAGRHGKRGQVFIQTRQADNPIIDSIVNNDYEGNAERQIEERENYNYPPFVRLMNITIKHKDEYVAQLAAQLAAQRLVGIFGNRVLGPQAPEIKRIATYFMQRIIIKIDKRSSPQKMKDIMMNVMNTLIAEEQFRRVIFSIDVDPY